MGKIFVERKIKVEELELWDENARFPDKYHDSSENELINYFVTKSNFKIKTLIDEIIKDFDLPIMEKLIVWDEDEKLIVLEGNRRITGYKLIINPEIIIETNKNLYNYIVERKKTINIDENFKLDCLVSSDKEQCYRYIDRKHSKNNNEVSWLEPEKINYSNRRGFESQNSKIKIAINNFVRNLELPEEVIDKILGRGYVTTFYRLIATGPAKKSYGLTTDENGNLKYTDKDFPDKLKVIIYNVLKKKDFSGNKVDTRELNKNPEIKNYLDSVNSQDVKKVENELNKNIQQDIFGKKTFNLEIDKTEETPISAKRNKPVPKGLFYSTDVPIRIGNTSLRTLYDELKNISVYDFPNATHDLLRSFLECSLIFFLKEIKEYELVKKSDVHNPKLGEMMTHIINGKCNFIKDQNLIASLKAIKTDFDQPYSLERMNMINHNENCTSTEKDVRKTWAQLESLFKIILNPIN
ncbi:hypothetical protein [Olleya sp. R77988]|uniref:hypothetical protein n=1 Tax=Olleya sp. R77988 TaxID=3093875 RepID=UPI0037CC215F